MEKSWTIIRFIDEDTVEAVPSTWIFSNKCYWPPFQMEKIVTAIKKHAEPNTCWPSYDIRTFRNCSYNNYGIAREKAKKAELTSELTSDTDNNDNSRKRKIVPKKFSSSDEDVEEDTRLQTPPTMQESSKSTNRGNVTSSNSQLKSTNSLPEEISSKRTKYLSDGLLDTCNNNYTSQDDEDKVQNNEIEGVCDKNAQYFKEIIRQQSYFKTQLWQIADDVRDMKNDLRKRQDVNQREETIFSFPHLPLNSVQHLEQQVEQFLNQPNIFKASVTEVARVGGKDPYEFIKRNCTRLLTNELAEKYSWLGVKEKRKFCDLKLADLLIVSDLESNSTYNKKVLEEAIKKWLRRAKERWIIEQKKL